MKKVSILSIAFAALMSLSALDPPLIIAQEESPEIKNEPDTQTVYQKIEQLTNAKGEYIEKEGVYRVTIPRSDIAAAASGIKLPPPATLSAWASFKVTGDNSMATGDLVLLEGQVNPVMNAVLDNGLEITAMHNHFFWGPPQIISIHIMGRGNTEKLAAAVGRVFAKIKETSGAKSGKPYPAIVSGKTTLDPKKIEDIIGVKGQMVEGVYKVTIGRNTSLDGEEIGSAMGVNTWAVFSGSDDKAVVDGDFAMLEAEVQPVINTLRAAGINIVAIQNHMLMEAPRMVFLHFWGTGSTVNLAKGLKSALDLQ